MRLAWMLVVLAGCPWVGGNGYEERVQDADGDGGIAVRFGGRDCQDDNPEIADCDADGDGVLSAVAGGDDCDDTDASVFPGATERCNGTDDDCDGLVDNDDPDTPATGSLFVDADGDGAGDPGSTRACQEYAVPGDLSSGIYVTNGADCDDGDPTIHPAADERCDGFDNNCDGAVDDVGLWFVDADNDGFGLTGTQATGSCDLTPGSGLAAQDGDCDDTDADVFPGQTETPYDGVDGNCNGGLDDWDVDFDGHVPAAHWAAASAANDLRPADQRWDIVSGDCDDNDPDRFVGNIEVCDGVDNDCDSAVDVADLASAGPTDEPTLRAQVQTLYVDQDGDGYHGSAVTLCPADVDASIHSLDNDDCFDGGPPPLGLESAVAAEVNAGAAERCDGFDNNCDGRVDHSLDPFPELTLHYFDADDDGFGSGQVYACGDDPVVGIVGVGGDCNDAQESVFPGAPEICGDAVRQDCSTAGIYDCDGDGFEGQYVGGGSGEDCDDIRESVYPNSEPGGEICDGLDNDCDGLVDSDDTDNLDAANEPLWYLDADDDGYGIGSDSIQQCDQPLGRVLLDGDCDDADPTLSPATLWYTDGDGDGYGLAASGVASCVAPSPQHVRNGADCNDLDPLFNPETEWMLDQDGDLRGDPSTLTAFCAPPPGEPWVLASNGVDCDDTEVAIQGSFTWYRDFDNDAAGDPTDTIEACVQPVVSGVRYVLVPGDCDDMDAARHPQREEVCNGIDDDCDALTDDLDPTLGGVVNGPIGFRDLDGDGFGGDVPKQFCFVVPQGWSAVGGDCDDEEPAAYPGAPEICDNGIDDDCDGSEQVPSWYADTDLDGFGAGAVVSQDCAPPAPTGYASVTGDCDDAEPTTFPGAPEVDACDAVDSDCDGEPEPRLTWYFDSDTDGFGADSTALTTCSPPNAPPVQGLTGEWVLQGGDCDDADPTITFGRIWFRDADGDTLGNDASTQFYCPQYDAGGEELTTFLLTDTNGNGTFDPGDVQLTVFGNDCNDANAAIGLPRTYFLDEDLDTWGRTGGQLLCPDPLGNPPAGRVERAGDCNDTDDQVYPGADETDGDSLDSNCDGLDNNESGIVWYPDSDGDGFGDRTAVGTTTYVNPSVTNNVDCDDADANVVNGIFVYTDGDLDAYGAGAPRFVSRCAPVAGESLVPTDCDDADAARRPGQLEVCDGLDQDCDGLVDEELPTSLAFPDLDDDGFGAGTASISYCGTVPPAGSSAFGTDCNDFDDAVRPGAVEVCNGIDDDCVGGIDNGLATVTSYFDGDGDGYGLTAVPRTSCDIPEGFVFDGGDCDDGRFEVNPGADEVCNGIDDDCDLVVDQGVGTQGFRDLDGDGDGDPAFPTTFCTTPTAGVATTGTDCDDLDPTVYEGAFEACDGKDNDCDGFAETRFRYYADLDEDGQGAGAYVEDCAQPPGSWSLASTDCDDSDPTVKLGEPEICDGKDNDCDGSLPAGEEDADRDGWLACDTDCDDTQALRHPGAAELCDGVADNDCDAGTPDPEVTDADLDGISACFDPDDTDGTVPGSGVTWYVDDDGDGFGGAVSGTDGVGVLNGLDCDDSRSDVHPGAPPVCEAGVDSDCDGTNDPANATWLMDADGDTYGNLIQALTTCVDPGPPWVPEDLFALDCDDGNASVRPGVTDGCNGIDDDCDGTIDEDQAAGVWVADVDGDGYANPGFAQVTCGSPGPLWILQSASLGDDCDDTEVSVNPDGTEVCNGLDDDCDDAVDEGVLDSYSLDRDGDGYLPVNTLTLMSCTDPGSPWVPTPDFPTLADCNDDAFAINPDATDVCDGIDNDCNGLIDDDFTNGVRAWYIDADGDGFAPNNAVSVQACASPGAGWVEGPVLLGDCDDQAFDVNPGIMVELCDDIDSRCNGMGDEPRTTWFVDSDGDGNGNGAISIDACTAPGPAWVSVGDDCDDSTALADPDNGPVDEICDGIDNDCSGSPGSGEVDADRDGFMVCEGDCDDSRPQRFPGNVEVCDSVPDNDCDPNTADIELQDFDADGYTYCFDPDDSDGTVPGIGGGPDDPTWYRDVDGDGYGDPGDTTTSATRPSGYVGNDGDCNDANANIRPGVDERCNGIDDNCDGAVTDLGEVDLSNPFTGTGITGAFPMSLYYTDVDANGRFSVLYGFFGCDMSGPSATSVTFNDATFSVYGEFLDGEPDFWNYVDCEDGSGLDGTLYGPDPDGDDAPAIEEADLSVLLLDCDGTADPEGYAPFTPAGWDCDPEDPTAALQVPDDGQTYYSDDDWDGYYRQVQPYDCVREPTTSPGPLDCDDNDPSATYDTAGTVVVHDQTELDEALAACFSGTIRVDNYSGVQLSMGLDAIQGQIVIEGLGSEFTCYMPTDQDCLQVAGLTGTSMGSVLFRDIGIVAASAPIQISAGFGSVAFEHVRLREAPLEVGGTIGLSLFDVEIVDEPGQDALPAITWTSTGSMRAERVDALGLNAPGSVFLAASFGERVELFDVNVAAYADGILSEANPIYGERVVLDKVERALVASVASVYLDGLTISSEDNNNTLVDLTDVDLTCEGCTIGGDGLAGGPAMKIDGATHANFFDGRFESLGTVAEVQEGASLYLGSVEASSLAGPLVENQGLVTLQDVTVASLGSPVIRQAGTPAAFTEVDGFHVRGEGTSIGRAFELYAGSVEGVDFTTVDVRQPLVVDRVVTGFTHQPVVVSLDGMRFDGIDGPTGGAVYLDSSDATGTTVPIDVELTDVEVNHPAVSGSSVFYVADRASLTLGEVRVQSIQPSDVPVVFDTDGGELDVDGLFVQGVQKVFASEEPSFPGSARFVDTEIQADTGFGLFVMSNLGTQPFDLTLRELTVRGGASYVVNASGASNTVEVGDFDILLDGSRPNHGFNLGDGITASLEDGTMVSATGSPLTVLNGAVVQADGLRLLGGTDTNPSAFHLVHNINAQLTLRSSLVANQAGSHILPLVRVQSTGLVSTDSTTFVSPVAADTATEAVLETFSSGVLVMRRALVEPYYTGATVVYQPVKCSTGSGTVNISDSWFKSGVQDTCGQTSVVSNITTEAQTGVSALNANFVSTNPSVGPFFGEDAL